MIDFIAAYALALQTVLAPLLASPAISHSLDGKPLFELCLDSSGATFPVGGGVPSGPHDHDIDCQLCVHGGLGRLDCPARGGGWGFPAAHPSIRRGGFDHPIPPPPRLL